MGRLIIENKKKPIKVLLLCEGTFPYIKGGVSTWIYQLIKGLPEINFGIVFLGANRNDYGGLQYEIPNNLVFILTDFLFDDINVTNMKKNVFRKKNKPFNEAIRGKYEYIRFFHDRFRSKKQGDFPDKIKHLDFYLNYITKQFFLYGKPSWDYIESQYLEFTEDSSFTSYFWTIRNVHAPIWKIVEIASALPHFEIIHSPSTGYAGFLGSILRYNRKAPFILTEHGIYVKERKIDILESDMASSRQSLLDPADGVEHLKTVWINFFEDMGRLCYSSADSIISLFGEAEKIQLSLGADSAKTRVIPNGVDIKKLSACFRKRKGEIPKIISFIGRIVRIKDVKTFIKAIKLVLNHIPDAQGWIVGPYDEDPHYVEECKNLVYMLGLENNCLFLGFRDIAEILPETGILALTSISEGMPLVVLEGFAAGVPAVCTDVGACRQLVCGGIDEADVAIGMAGEIVPIANPKAIADAYADILTKKEKWHSASNAGLKRVSRYYSMKRFLNNYSNVYEEFYEKWQEFQLS